jgi:hypothetical protein
LFGLQAFLLGLQDLFGDAVLVVEVEELVLVADEFADTSFMPVGVLARRCGAGVGAVA